MLTEVRHQNILKRLQEQKAVTVEELTIALQTSESTIRRDLNVLSKMGKLNKVHGGATCIADSRTKEEHVSIRQQEHVKEKRDIGKYAASLLEEGDFIYLDAGTTTECMIEYIEIKDITFVTNGILQAQLLLKKGYRVFLLGGELKQITEAIIGNGALHSMKHYNFSKGFFGTNGVSVNAGFTTPEMNEATIKEEAMKHCKKAFVLADHSKLQQVTPITFASLDNAILITDICADAEIKKEATVIELENI